MIESEVSETDRVKYSFSLFFYFLRHYSSPLIFRLPIGTNEAFVVVRPFFLLSEGKGSERWVGWGRKKRRRRRRRGRGGKTF